MGPELWGKQGAGAPHPAKDKVCNLMIRRVTVRRVIVLTVNLHCITSFCGQLWPNKELGCWEVTWNGLTGVWFAALLKRLKNFLLLFSRVQQQRIPWCSQEKGVSHPALIYDPRRCQVPVFPALRELSQIRSVGQQSPKQVSAGGGAGGPGAASVFIS